jgi:PKHD-type hydroxylase
MFNIDQIKQIDNFCQENFNPDLQDQPAENVIKTAQVRCVSWSKIKNLINIADQAMKHINSREIGFDLYDMTDLENTNYNVYKSDTKAEYDWHTDAMAAGSQTDIKLTVIINISTESFQGGQFQLFRHGIMTAEELTKPGSMIIFPSYIPHRVLPVTQGTRKSLSWWVLGPKFR